MSIVQLHGHIKRSSAGAERQPSSAGVGKIDSTRPPTVLEEHEAEERRAHLDAVRVVHHSEIRAVLGAGQRGQQQEVAAPGHCSRAVQGGQRLVSQMPKRRARAAVVVEWVFGLRKVSFPLFLERRG